MKLFCPWSQSHKRMFYEYLLPSTQKQFDVVGIEQPQECPTGVYRSEGWVNNSVRKTRLCRDLSESEPEPFVFSDADVVCNGFSPDDVNKELDGFDLACLYDTSGPFCSGFMFLRPGKATTTLFETALDNITVCDEPALNHSIEDIGTMVKAKLLPTQFYTNYYWLSGGKHFPDGLNTISIPKTVKVFHANFIVGIEPKEQALKWAASWLK